MLQSWDLFPLNLYTFSIFACAYFFVLSVINWLAMIIGRVRFASSHHRFLLAGSFNIFFYLTCFLHILAAFILPIYFALNILYIWKNNLIFAIIALFINFVFWVLCLYRFIENRHFHEQPISLVLTYGATVILLILPLFFWKFFFSSGYFLFKIRIFFSILIT